MDPFLTEVAAVNFCHKHELSSMSHFIRIHIMSEKKCKKQVERNFIFTLKPVKFEVIWKSPSLDGSLSTNTLIGVAYEKIGNTLSSLNNIHIIGAVTIGSLMENSALFDRYYPEKKISNAARKKIFGFLRHCNRKGLGGADGHPENIAYYEKRFYLISAVSLE